MEANQLPESCPDALDEAHRLFLYNVHLETVPLHDGQGRLDTSQAHQVNRKLERLYGDGLRRWAGKPGFILFAATPEAYDRRQEQLLAEGLGHIALV